VLIDGITKNQEDLSTALDYFKMLVTDNKYSEMKSLDGQSLLAFDNQISREMDKINGITKKNRSTMTLDLVN